MPKSRSVPTAEDVARLAGVSTATVSYVLSGRRNGAARISEETRQRILDAVAMLNYVPNHTARSLRRQRTNRVCLVVQSLGVPYYDYLARDVQQMAEQYDYSLIITVGGSLTRERQILQQLQQGLADGAILIPKSIGADDLAPLVKAGLSLTVISNRVFGAGFDTVQSNEAEACYAALTYLLDQGHRRIAFLGHSVERTEDNKRLASYLRAFGERGIPVDESLLQPGAASREAAYHSSRALLAHPDRPSAIFATSDIAAISAIWTIRDVGLRVPDDIAVIGMGNIPEGEGTRPALTTIGPATFNFSAVAELLFSRLAGQAPAEGRVDLIPWTLIRRGSA